MLLQRLQLPTIGEDTEKLYIRNLDKSISITDEILTYNSNKELAFDTYFNSFSYEKWAKYTNINDIKLQLSLKGNFKLTLISLSLKDNEVLENVISSRDIIADDFTTQIFSFPKHDKECILAFKLVGKTGSVFYKGAYISENSNPLDVALNLCICTFKRERYVYDNMTMLKNDLFDVQDILIKDKIHVNLVDNGNTLPFDEITNNAHVTLYPNLNSGGSGGFSRGIIETLLNKDGFPATHVVLMDDDVRFTIPMLEQLYAFVSLIKEEYKNSFIGLAMLKIEKPWCQHASGEKWTKEGFVFNKTNFDMRLRENVLLNEVEEDVNYLGWWGCCIPLEVANSQNLSLPLFVQKDDLEYGIRNADSKKITLNGLCLWHEDFHNKWNASKIYYDIRNTLILNTIHFNDFTKDDIKRLIKREVIKSLLRYRVKQANLVIRAFEDYCKGLDWLIAERPQLLHKEISSENYGMQDFDSIEGISALNVEDVDFEDHGYIKKTEMVKILLGMLLPANRNVVVPASMPRITKFYRAKRVINLDRDTKKAFETHRNNKEFLRIYRETNKLLNEKYSSLDSIMNKYRDEYKNVITEQFWTSFLELDSKGELV